MCGGHDDGALEGEMRVRKRERDGRAYYLQINALQPLRWWWEGQIYHVPRDRSAGGQRGTRNSPQTPHSSPLVPD